MLLDCFMVSTINNLSMHKHYSIYKSIAMCLDRQHWKVSRRDSFATTHNIRYHCLIQVGRKLYWSAFEHGVLGPMAKRKYFGNSGLLVWNCIMVRFYFRLKSFLLSQSKKYLNILRLRDNARASILNEQ